MRTKSFYVSDPLCEAKLLPAGREAFERRFNLVGNIWFQRTRKRRMKRLEHIMQMFRESECLACGFHKTAKQLTIDHIVPRAMGGHPSSPANLMPLCHECNNKKQDLEPTTWFLGLPQIQQTTYLWDRITLALDVHKVWKQF
jgi:5-methylcytosine-specific restriction endonuclease McrA